MAETTTMPTRDLDLPEQLFFSLFLLFSLPTLLLALSIVLCLALRTISIELPCTIAGDMPEASTKRAKRTLEGQRASGSKVANRTAPGALQILRECHGLRMSWEGLVLSKGSW